MGISNFIKTGSYFLEQILPNIFMWSLKTKYQKLFASNESQEHKLVIFFIIFKKCTELLLFPKDEVFLLPSENRVEPESNVYTLDIFLDI